MKMYREPDNAIAVPGPRPFALPAPRLPVCAVLLAVLLSSSPIFAGSGEETRPAARPAGRGVGQDRVTETEEDCPESGKLDINTAAAAELETLPRIGSARARAIVDYRDRQGRFEKIEDILNVYGIGPQTFEILRDRIRVSPPELDSVEVPDRVGGIIETRRTAPAPGNGAGNPPEEVKIDINTATAWELQKLPWIGPARAQAIIDYRQDQGSFEKIEDIVRVRGIGPKTFEALESRIRVVPPPED